MSISVGRPVHFLVALTVAAVPIVSGAEGVQPPKFDWAVRPLSAKPLVIGESSLYSVVRHLLGPTYRIDGDGSNGSELCYLLTSSSGANVRLVLRFSGSFEGGELAAMEWRAMTSPLDTWIGRICRMPSRGTIGTGLDSGVKLGEVRSKLRLILGAPSTSSAEIDEYARVSQNDKISRSTKLTLKFDSRGVLVGLDVNRKESQ